MSSPAEEPTAKPPQATPASVTLPSTFQNSFWTPDYRSGFTTLYEKLEGGVVESEELIGSIRRRAATERTMGQALQPPALRHDGFGLDEGASLKMGLEALLSSAVQESRARQQLADELQRSIAIPFEEWSEAHKGRIRSSKALIESHLIAYEKKLGEVSKLKALYDDACRVADSAEDELSFLNGSPGEEVKDKAKAKARQEGSDDGIDDIDDDDTLIGRSGATGGSIIAALGRAVSVRRKHAPSDAGSPSKELPSTPFSAEPNVGAALDWSKTTFTSLLEKVAGPQTGEGKNDKARKDAEAAEERYKTGVEALDSLRLVLEETLHEHLTYVNRCEHDRIKAAASVLRGFHASVVALPKLLAPSGEKVSSALELIRPERDVVAIIERLRTGPFQPRPTVYHSHYSEPAIHSFGIDLRKFDETNTLPNKVPIILTSLLECITESYKLKEVSDAEQRKAWLYETPLAAQHHLRSALNNPDQLSRAVLEKYDLPVVAATVKLWLLELEVPVIIFSHYDEYRQLYPKRVGAEIIEVPAKAIAAHVARLPPVHLEVLRVVISHFVQLLATTKTEESDEVFLQKLSLSVARCLLRPKQETPLTLDDRFPTLLFIDLVKSYDEIFKSADELKTKQREDRYKPRRQRTKPIDLRLSRSSMGSPGAIDPSTAGELLKSHQIATSPPPVPAVPAMPTFNEPLPSPPLPTVPLPRSPSPSVSTPTTQSPSLPIAQPASPPAVPTIAQPTSPASTSSSPGSGSLSRRDGRRGARGPRPLPSSVEGTASPVLAAAGLPTEEGRKRSASFERRRAAFEEAGKGPQ